MSRLRATPARRTALLTAGLTLTSVALAAVGPDQPLLGGEPRLSPRATLAVLAGLFCAADLCLLHVEVRRQAYSMTLAGLPLALGLLLCDSRELVAVRVLGSAAAFAIQRSPGPKAAYNLSAYALEAALDVAVVHLILPAGGLLSVQTAAVCYLVLAAVDQLMSLLVVQVIGWHQGRMTAGQMAAVHLPALICSVLASTAAYGTFLLAQQGALGAFVLLVSLLAAATSYRSVQILHRRHESLAHVHDFVGLNNGGLSAEDLAGRMLEQARSLMRAARAVLVIVEGNSAMQLSVEEDGSLQVRLDGWAARDWLVTRVRELQEPSLLSTRTRDRAVRAWLRDRQVRDAVIVPLPAAAR